MYILSLSCCWLTFHCVTYAQVRSVLDAAWATRPVFLIRYSLSRRSLRAPYISLSAISQLHRVLPMHYGALHLMLGVSLCPGRCNDCSNVCMHVSNRGAFTIFQCSFICMLFNCTQPKRREHRKNSRQMDYDHEETTQRSALREAACGAC